MDGALDAVLARPGHHLARLVTGLHRAQADLAQQRDAGRGELGYKAGDFPHAERAAAEVLALPIYPELSADQQSYVVEQIASFYGVPA